MIVIHTHGTYKAHIMYMGLGGTIDGFPWGDIEFNAAEQNCDVNIDDFSKRYITIIEEYFMVQAGYALGFSYYEV